MVKTDYLSRVFHNISFQQLLKKLNNRRFWRDSGLLILANVIVTILGLIRTPAMTWLLPKEEYGMISAVSAWIPFLQLLSLSGMDSATYHYVAKNLRWAFFTNVSIRLRWSLISAFGFICLALYWNFRGQSNLAILFLITGLSYPLTTGLSVSANILAAQENFKKLFYYRIFESLVDFTGFIPLVFSGWIISRIVSFYTANQFAATILQVSYCFWIANKLRQQDQSQPTVEENHELITYGKHLTLISGISVVQSRTDALLVSALLPLETMADYSIGLLVSEQFKRLWVIYVNLRYPPLVRMAPLQRIKRIWIEGIIVWGGFFGIMMVGLLFAHLLIPIILPANYSNSLIFIDLLSIGAVIGVPGMIIELYFRMKQQAKPQYYIRVTAAFVNLIIPYFLILSYGAQGAAVGKIIANLSMTIVGLFLIIWETNRIIRGGENYDR